MKKIVIDGRFLRDDIFDVYVPVLATSQHMAHWNLNVKHKLEEGKYHYVKFKYFRRKSYKDRV